MISRFRLRDKQRWEIVPYQFDFKKVFPTGETISSIAFGIYLDGEDPSAPTLIPTMVYATSFSGTVVQCDTGSGNDGIGDYVLRARVTCVSGRRYESEGLFTVTEV